jgi:hypothetical protein
VQAKDISPAKAQRRKESPLENAAALCAFAPLRHKYFLFPNGAMRVEVFVDPERLVVV